MNFEETSEGWIAPRDWNVVALSEAVNEIDYGLSAPIPKTPPAHGVKIVSTADITKAGRIRYDQIRKISAPPKTITRLTLRDGDVLFNWRNSAELIGKTGVFREQPELHIFASFILRIRCGETKSHNLFLSYLMNYYRQAQVFLKLARRAVNQANYNRNEIGVLRIPLPPYDEQRKIACVLGLVQRAIEQQERLLTLIAELKKVLLHHLFTVGLRAEVQKQTDLGLVPESWQVVKMASLGKVVTGTTPKTAVPEYYTPHDIDFIAPADLGHTRQVYNSVKKISRLGLEVARGLPKNAVMCVCIGSSIGKVGMTAKDASATNQQINSLICNEKHDPTFVYYLLTHFAEYWRNFATFGPVPILNKGAFEAIEIVVPPTKAEETEIAQSFIALDARAEMQMRRKVLIDELFSTLLHQLMTGQIRVNELDLSELEARNEC